MLLAFSDGYYWISFKLEYWGLVRCTSYSKYTRAWCMLQGWFIKGQDSERTKTVIVLSKPAPWISANISVLTWRFWNSALINCYMTWEENQHESNLLRQKLQFSIRPKLVCTFRSLPILWFSFMKTCWKWSYFQSSWKKSLIAFSWISPLKKLMQDLPTSYNAHSNSS